MSIFKQVMCVESSQERAQQKREDRARARLAGAGAGAAGAAALTTAAAAGKNTAASPKKPTPAPGSLGLGLGPSQQVMQQLMSRNKDQVRKLVHACLSVSLSLFLFQPDITKQGPKSNHPPPSPPTTRQQCLCQCLWGLRSSFAFPKLFCSTDKIEERCFTPAKTCRYIVVVNKTNPLASAFVVST